LLHVMFWKENSTNFNRSVIFAKVFIRDEK
jgi:hypothetical protein